MESCLGACSDGSVSPETVRRWTESVHNVLSTATGISKFHDFLENCDTEDDLEDGIYLIIFWEKCHKLVPDDSFTKRKKPSSSQESVEGNEFQTAEGIIQYAFKHDILDSGRLKNIQEGITEKDYSKTMSAIYKAKEDATIELKKYHNFFKKYLKQVKCS